MEGMASLLKWVLLSSKEPMALSAKNSTFITSSFFTMQYVLEGEELVANDIGLHTNGCRGEARSTLACKEGTFQHGSGVGWSDGKGKGADRA